MTLDWGSNPLILRFLVQCSTDPTPLTRAGNNQRQQPRVCPRTRGAVVGVRLLHDLPTCRLTPSEVTMLPHAGTERLTARRASKVEAEVIHVYEQKVIL